MAGNNLIGVENFQNSHPRTQVFQATHTGAGERLSPMNKSFISFSYGGKFIEDFGLIVTFNDRLNKNIYANFEDITSSYEMLDGQYFWGSHMSNNNLNLTLSTDGMTQVQLEDFKNWFAPGVERPLILSEHPNRQILARISNPPTISMIPFEDNREISIGGYNYLTKTTLYKGEINISFIMDEPYWTGIMNYIPENINLVEEEIEDHTNNIITFEDYTEAITWFKNNISNDTSSEDALKICLEDNIPHFSQLANKTKLFLGSPYISALKDPHIGVIKMNSNSIGYYLDSNPTSITIKPDSSAELIYSGTAPSYPYISFDMKLNFDSIDNRYILNPRNTYANTNIDEKSFIQIGENKFYFTTPGLITSYNKAVNIVKNSEETLTVQELSETFKEDINNKYVRAWAIGCISSLKKKKTLATILSEITYREIVLRRLRHFWKTSDSAPNGVDVSTWRKNTVHFTLDFKTGIVTADYYINQFLPNTSIYSLCNFVNVTENAGDMLLSEGIALTERNYFNEGQLVTTNISSNETLKNFFISYENKYF